MEPQMTKEILYFMVDQSSKMFLNFVLQTSISPNREVGQVVNDIILICTKNRLVNSSISLMQIN